MSAGRVLNLQDRETAIRRAVVKEALLKDILAQVRNGNSAEEFASRAARMLTETLKADAGSVAFIIGGERIIASAGEDREGRELIDCIIALSEEPQAITCDVNNLPASGSALAEYMEATRAKSLLAVPIRFADEKIGAIVFEDSVYPRKWSSHEMDVVESAAAELAIGLRYLEAMREVLKANEELKSHAEKLQATLEKEKQLNELQSEFIALASHEFRTPLAVIDGAAQILEKTEAPTPEYMQKQLFKIRKSVVGLTRLVESCLDLSKLEKGKVRFNPGNCNIRQLIKDTAGRLSDAGDRHVFKFGIDKLPEIVTADAEMMEHVIGNILSNAVKYSPEGGVVEVTGRREGDTVYVSVGDEGMGIPEAELSRVGEKFFRAQNSVGIPGSGIGLHVCRNFMEMHGGGMEVKNRPVTGTEVTIHFPAWGDKQ